MRIIKKKKENRRISCYTTCGCNNWNDDKVKVKNVNSKLGVWTGTWIPNKLLL